MSPRQECRSCNRKPDRRPPASNLTATTMVRRFLYSFGAYLALPIICLVMLWRGLRGHRNYWRDFSQRFGFGPVPSGPCIWVHAVSFGEVQAAAALIFAPHRVAWREEAGSRSSRTNRKKNG